MRFVHLIFLMVGFQLAGSTSAFANPSDTAHDPFECETELALLNEDLLIVEEELTRLTGQPASPEAPVDQGDERSCVADLAQTESEFNLVHIDVHVAVEDTVVTPTQNTGAPICVRTCSVAGCDACVAYVELPEIISR